MFHTDRYNVGYTAGRGLSPALCHRPEPNERYGAGYICKFRRLYFPTTSDYYVVSVAQRSFRFSS